MIRFIVILLFPLFSLCQEKTYPVNAKGKIEFSAVVNVDSTDAATLYSRSKLFIAKTFASGKAVTELNDDNTKQIVGNGTVKIVTKEPMIGTYHFGFVEFTITIQSKEGKYRYFINDFVHTDNTGNGGSGGMLENEKPNCSSFLMPKKRWGRIKDTCYIKIISLISELDKYMKGQTSESSSDW